MGNSCGPSHQIGQCRLSEPCTPTVLPWNKTFVAVSWKGIFEGCHEDDIFTVLMRRKDTLGGISYKQIDYETSKVFISKGDCANSLISIELVLLQPNESVPESITTDYINCTASLINGKIYILSLNTGWLFLTGPPLKVSGYIVNPIPSVRIS